MLCGTIGRLSLSLQNHLLWIGDVEPKKQRALAEVDKYAARPAPGSLEKRVIANIVEANGSADGDEETEQCKRSYFGHELKQDRQRRSCSNIKTFAQLRPELYAGLREAIDAGVSIGEIKDHVHVLDMRNWTAELMVKGTEGWSMKGDQATKVFVADYGEAELEALEKYVVYSGDVCDSSAYYHDWATIKQHAARNFDWPMALDPFEQYAQLCEAWCSGALELSSGVFGIKLFANFACAAPSSMILEQCVSLSLSLIYTHAHKTFYTHTHTHGVVHTQVLHTHTHTHTHTQVHLTEERL